MTCISVRCPHGHREQVVKRGKTHRGTQRSLCQNMACAKGSLLLDYRNRGCLPEVQHTIIDLRLNARGVRDMARVLRIRTDTVLCELKKKEAALASVNTACRCPLNPDEMAVPSEPAGEAEMAERGSFVGKQGNPRWLWQAIDHHTGALLASAWGRRKAEVFLPLKALGEPLGLTRFYTDHWGAYPRHLAPDVYSPGQRNTPKIERKHLT